MSIPVVEETTSFGAWQAGALLIIKNGSLKNLITTIHDPCSIDLDWLDQRSPHKVISSADNIRDVINTIFPERLRARTTTRSELYTKYHERHRRAKKMRGRTAWGTYFERLTSFPPTGVNQLERAIEKLNTWPQRNMTGLVFHLSCPTIDAPRTRGGPCWQFAEILWNADGTLDLVVVYRNHDFFNKALGNFIGLGYLLKFICDQSKKLPGKLICHSCHAFSDGTLKALRQIIA